MLNEYAFTPNTYLKLEITMYFICMLHTCVNDILDRKKNLIYVCIVKTSLSFIVLNSYISTERITQYSEVSRYRLKYTLNSYTVEIPTV